LTISGETWSGAQMSKRNNRLAILLTMTADGC